MTVSTIIRDWLLLVGDQYGVREAHQDRRRADQCNVRAPFFVYRFADSVTRPGVAGDLSSASGSHNIVEEYYKLFTRTLEIECHTPMRPDLAGEVDGMRVLEAVQVSLHAKAVAGILNSEPANRMSMRDALTMTNDTEVDEQSIYRMFSLSMTVDINTHFALTQADARVDDYTLTGTLEADSGDTITVSASGETS